MIRLPMVTIDVGKPAPNGVHCLGLLNESEAADHFEYCKTNNLDPGENPCGQWCQFVKRNDER